jgi:LmbE family N-acetylglucosaminyl deacetylase
MPQAPVLVVAAHPDDEVLGCGGTIARLSAEGREVIIAIFGEGLTSRESDRKDANPVEVDALRARAKDVAGLLGAKELITFGLPDNRFDTVPLLDVVKRVEGLVDQFRPSLVFTHSGGDLNIDHVVLHRAVLTATRPMAGQSVKEIYAFEVASSTEWAFGQFAPAFRPGMFVDISTCLEKKVQAMERYESEARTFPHPRSAPALRAIAQRWGSVVGLEAAEPFELVRQIR